MAFQVPEAVFIGEGQGAERAVDWGGEEEAVGFGVVGAGVLRKGREDGKKRARYAVRRESGRRHVARCTVERKAAGVGRQDDAEPREGGGLEHGEFEAVAEKREFRRAGEILLNNLYLRRRLKINGRYLRRRCGAGSQHQQQRQQGQKAFNRRSPPRSEMLFRGVRHSRWAASHIRRVPRRSNRP